QAAQRIGERAAVAMRQVVGPRDPADAGVVGAGCPAIEAEGDEIREPAAREAERAVLVPDRHHDRAVSLVLDDAADMDAELHGTPTELGLAIRIHLGSRPWAVVQRPAVEWHRPFPRVNGQGAFSNAWGSGSG